MSFNKELTSHEISEIIKQPDKMLNTKGFEKSYEWALAKIKEYPNCNMLIWQSAITLDAARLTDICTEPEM